jgi:serine/threonine protein kinase
MTLEDRYVTLEDVAEGGQAMVMRAVTSEGEVHAVKEMKLVNNHSSERFEREASLKAMDRHSNVVQILDSWNETDDRGRTQHYIAMDWIEGPTASEAIKDKTPLSSQQLEEILDEGVSGLDAIHSLGIIHRDMKPNNVKLAPEGLKIFDFGVLKYDGQTTGLESMGLGSPWYWSPEQHKLDESVSLTPATDRYSLGLIVLDLARKKRRALDPNKDNREYVDGLSFLEPSLKSKLNMLLDPSPEGRYEGGIVKAESDGLTRNDGIKYTLTGAAIFGMLGYSIFSPEAGALGLGLAFAGVGSFVGSVTAVVYDSILKKGKKALPSQVIEADYVEDTPLDELADNINEEGNLTVPLISHLPVKVVPISTEEITSDDTLYKEKLTEANYIEQTSLDELANHVDANGEISGASLIQAGQIMDTDVFTLDNVVETAIVPYKPSELREVTQRVTEGLLQITKAFSMPITAVSFLGTILGTFATVVTGEPEVLYDSLMLFGLAVGSKALSYGTEKYFKGHRFFRGDEGKIGTFWRTVDEALLNPSDGRINGIKHAYRTRKNDREINEIVEELRPLSYKLRNSIQTPQDFFNSVAVLGNALDERYSGNVPPHVVKAVQKKHVTLLSFRAINKFFNQKKISDKDAMSELAKLDIVAEMGGYKGKYFFSGNHREVKWFANNVIHESLRPEQEAQYGKRFSQGDMTYTQIAKYMQETSPINSTWLPMEVEEDVLGLETKTTENKYGWEYLELATKQVGSLRSDGTRIDVDLERLDEVRHEGADFYARGVARILSRSSYGIRHDIDDSLEGEIAVAIEHKKLKPSYIAENLHKNPMEW